jgi:group II intron maturase
MNSRRKSGPRSCRYILVATWTPCGATRAVKLQGHGPSSSWVDERTGRNASEARAGPERVDADVEPPFDFLGYTFKMQRSFKNGRHYHGALPSVKAVKRLKGSIRHQLHRANMNPIELVVERLNRTLRGWANYFRYGTVLRVRQNLDRFICDRVRYFLARRAKSPTRGTYRYGWDYVFGELGVVSLKSLPRVAT